MGNCLETKLKESVNNPNLPIFKCMRCTVNVASLNDVFAFRATEANKVLMSIVSAPTGGEILDALKNPQGQSWFLPTDGGNYFSVIGTYVLEFSEKYEISIFDAGSNNSAFDLSDFKYLSDVTYLRGRGGVIGDISDVNYSSLDTIQIQAADITGSISVFNGNTTITNIVFNSCANIEGDIASLATCSALTSFQASNTKISGSLASLLENGHKKNPALTTLYLPNTPNLTKNQADVDALTADGVTVYV